MNPNQFRVRMDRTNGNFWLTRERTGRSMERVKDITADILLSLCADLFEKEGTQAVSRDVTFDDGTQVEVIIREKVPEQPQPTS